MKHWLFVLALALFAGFPALAQPQQEVVLSASANARLGVAVPAPQLTGLDAALVQKDFHEVLQRDLEEAGPFTLVKDRLPRSTEPSAYKAWLDSGTEWLVLCRLSPAAEDVELVVQVTDVRSGKGVFSKKYLGKPGVLRRIAHAVSDDLVARLTGERGLAATHIVFVRAAGQGIKELWQLDRDGSNAVQLTHHRSLSLSPTVAADGRLAYMTYKGGSPEIWGQRKPGGPHVKLYPAGGKTEGHCYAPAWSPDGRRLAFVQGDRRGNSDIVVLDLATGRARRLTDSNCINTSPCWNPAGTQLAFTSDRSGTPQIYLMEDDGSNVRRLTTEGNYNESPSWSPGGSMIAYVSRFEGKFDLFVYKLGAGKAYQITTGVASSANPDWRPAARRIVFTSGSRGGMQLFTIDLSGNGLRRLTEFSGCQSPRWARSR